MRTTLDVWARPQAWVGSELNNLFDELVSSPTRAATEFRPACDFEETDTHYLFSLDVPGLNKDDIKIEVTADTLTVEGERKFEERGSKDGQRFHERRFGKFTRAFEFPQGVDAEKVEAEYTNGVLKISLAKVAAALPRKVDIKVA